jgi:predicted Kef-type K+ transport protein
MPDSAPLISTLVFGLVLAFGFGLVAQRLRLPPLIGYLLAGIAIGPFTPGFVADQSIANQLAEIGVILLMFGVGLHERARALIADERHWCRGHPAQDARGFSFPNSASAVRRCALGALIAAAYE